MNSSFYRDAERVAREQSNHAKRKGQTEKALFWRKQADHYSVEADRHQIIQRYVQERNETIFLLLKEAVTQGWTCGHILDDDVYSWLYLEHPFCGVFKWRVPTNRIPGWISVYQGAVRDVDDEIMYQQIDKYLRPLDD